jgi:2,3,4,5-tetrahydropyridine-2,6-dicarboxylate N-succinyltransferase
MTTQLAATIEAAWDARDTVTPESSDVRAAVEAAFALLESGEARVAEKIDGEWVVNQWLKKAVLLSFRLNDNAVLENGMGGAPAWDKVAIKTAGWGEDDFRAAGFRAVPGAVARVGCHIAKGVVLMPSFVNLGASSIWARWSTPGPPWVPVPRSARTSTFRAAPASAACWNRFRPARSSSRTAPSSARVAKWPRA